MSDYFCVIACSEYSVAWLVPDLQLIGILSSKHFWCWATATGDDKLEVQAAGRAQCGVACGRLLTTNNYTWASTSSLILFFFSFLWAFQNPMRTFQHIFSDFKVLGLLPAVSPHSNFSPASNSVYAQVWRKMQKKPYKIFSSLIYK